MSLINTEIKPFKATAYHNGKFVPVTNETLKGKWSVVVFYPADFTFICPTELVEFNKKTGLVEVSGKEWRGKLHLREGRIIAAQTWPQALGKGRARIAREEGLDLPRIAAIGVADEQPVGGIGLEQVPGEARPVAFERFPLPALRRFPGGEHVGVARGLGAASRRREREGGRAHPNRERLDASQGHSHHR